MWIRIKLHFICVLCNCSLLDWNTQISLYGLQLFPLHMFRIWNKLLSSWNLEDCLTVHLPHEK